MTKNTIKNKTSEIILFLSIFSFLYFWDLSRSYNIQFDFRLLIFLYLPFLLKDIIKLNYKLFIIFLLLTVHYYGISIFYDYPISIKNSLLILLVFYFLLFTYNIQDKLIYLLYQIVTTFFILSTILIFINFNNIEFHFKDSISSACTIFKDVSSLKYRIFTENSHFGMIAPASIFFFLMSLDKYNFKKRSLIFLPMIILVLIMYASTTLYVGIVLSSIYMLLTFKKEYFYNYLLFFFIFVLTSSIFFSKKECYTRLLRANVIDYIKLSIIKDKNNSEKILKQINEDDLIYANPNITTEVYENAIFVTFSALKNNILGYGINNYSLAFDKFTPLNIQKSNNHYKNANKNISNRGNLTKEIEVLNRTDARSNLLKMTTEFGLFSIFFYIYLIFFSFSKKIDIRIKSFIVPMIITQLISGAGYFNGGFIFVVALSYVLLISKKISYDH